MEMTQNLLEFIIERMYFVNEIPVHVFSADQKLILKVGSNEHLKDERVYDQYLMDSFFVYCKKQENPVVVTDDNIFYYGAFYDLKERFYIYGPIAIEKPDGVQLHHFRERHHIENSSYAIRTIDLMSLVTVLSIMYSLVTGRTLTEKEILGKNYSLETQKVSDEEVSRYLFEKTEHGKEHFNYQYEQRYLLAVEEGDLEYFRHSLTYEPKALDKIGQLAKSSYKHTEYMVVSSIVLISRAAIRGGLNPSVVYSLSELYMQKLANCKVVDEALKLHQIMQLDFVTRVREYKDKVKSEDYIEATKDYITRHVHSPIRISDVAQVVGMNHSYLSKKFREAEGMTIVQYSIQAKILAAANMLKYSEASLAEITDYFCFASQSRFGTVFKKTFGVTPLVYRKEHKIIDFKSQNE